VFPFAVIAGRRVCPSILQTSNTRLSLIHFKPSVVRFEEQRIRAIHRCCSSACGSIEEMNRFPLPFLLLVQMPTANQSDTMFLLRHHGWKTGLRHVLQNGNTRLSFPHFKPNGLIGNF
jgi:hypothetical protein